MANWGQSSREWQDPEANKLPETVEKLEAKDEIPETSNGKKVVVVGLGMVGISFMFVPSRVISRNPRLTLWLSVRN